MINKSVFGSGFEPDKNDFNCFKTTSKHNYTTQIKGLNQHERYQPYKGPVFSGSRGGCSQQLLPGSIGSCVIEVELPCQQNLLKEGSLISKNYDIFQAEKDKNLQPF